MLNSVMLFTFFFFDQKYSFRVNMTQNVKIVSLRLNLVASISILKSHTHQREYHQPSVLRFDTSYKGGKRFLPMLKLLVLTCVICCN